MGKTDCSYWARTFIKLHRSNLPAVLISASTTFTFTENSLEKKHKQHLEQPEERDGDEEKALWGPSFSSTSGPDISELISHAGVVCR